VRILTVIHAFPPEGRGGTERYAETVALGLRQRGHQVHVLTGSIEWQEELTVDRVQHQGLEVVRIHRSDLYFDHWDKTANPHVSKIFEQELQRLQPDVVHLHHWIRLSQDLLRRSAAHGVPSIVHLHDLFTTCPRVFRVREEDQNCQEKLGPQACLSCVPRWLFQGDPEITASLHHYRGQLAAELRAAQVRLAPSESHARALQEFWQLPDVPVEVLPHPRLPGSQRRDGRPGTGAGALRVLFFSQLAPVKGAHVLLEALRLLGSESGVVVDLYGTPVIPEYEQRLRQMAVSLEVHFHGSYEPQDQATWQADVVVIPALARESYSFWLDEALDLGLPVVVASIGALAERDSARLRFFPPGDAQALAGLLRELRDQPALREQMAASPAPTPLDLNEHLKSLEATLQRAVEQGVTPPPEPMPKAEDLTHEWDRREWGFRELLRSEGWEQALADLHSRLPPAPED
jgi:glycosyltransferase involved in cell wall biosynthesis